MLTFATPPSHNCCAVEQSNEARNCSYIESQSWQPTQRLRIIGDSIHRARQVIRDQQGAIQKRRCVYWAPCALQIILSGRA